METFSLFSVTPIGLALVTTGILYFVLAGRFVLPVVSSKGTEAGDAMDYFRDTYGLRACYLYELVVNSESPVVGMSVDELEKQPGLRVIAVDMGDGPRVGADSVNRELGIAAGTVLGVLSADIFIKAIAKEYNLRLKSRLDVFSDVLSPVKAGIAELVIPPSSSLIGKSAREVWLRKKYGLSLLAIHRGDAPMSFESGGIRNEKFHPGDLLVVHTTWADLARLKGDRDFVIVTTEYPHEELRPTKVPHAAIFFLITLGLVLFSDLRLSVALLTGAMGMVLSGVLSIDEAYRAVSWKTVFLLASLIPLGLAVEHTGTAAWIAQQTLRVVGDMPIWVIPVSYTHLTLPTNREV